MLVTLAMRYKKWLFALLFLSAAAAQAHDFHAGITDIAYNERTGNTEVVHTLMMHDVDALLTAIAKHPVDLSKPEGERLLRRYLEARFAIEDASKRPLTLQWIGVQADTQNVTVYQELAATQLGPRHAIRNAILSDFLPDQRNTVNLRSKVQNQSQTRSLMFDQSLVRQVLR